MNVAAALAIREGDREQLEALAQSPGMAQRAQIVLLAAAGMANTEIARLVGASRPTVLKWRNRYEARGVAGLDDGQRSGRPVTIDEVEVLGETLADGGKPPAQLGVAQWSARLMADRLGISFASVARIWRKHDIQPHRIDAFRLPTDPEMEARLHDVVGLYLSPPTLALVISTDMESAVTAGERNEPTSRLRQDCFEQTDSYIRGGTAELFTALEVAVDKISFERTSRDTRAAFVDFLDQVSAAHPRVPLRVICDNYAAHRDVRGERDENPLLSVHCTAPGRQWLTVVGVLCDITTRQAIRRDVEAKVSDLEVAIRAYVNAQDECSSPFTWIKNADAAIRMGKCKSINNTLSR
jgi:transposase